MDDVSEITVPKSPTGWYIHDVQHFVSLYIWFDLFLILLQIGALCCIVIYAYKDIYHLHFPVILGIVILLTSVFLCLTLIKLQPENPTAVFFKVPLVPWLPALSLLINFYLLLLLDKGSWIRFGIWMLLGKSFKIFMTTFLPSTT